MKVTRNISKSSTEQFGHDVGS